MESCLSSIFYGILQLSWVKRPDPSHHVLLRGGVLTYQFVTFLFPRCDLWWSEVVLRILEGWVRLPVLGHVLEQVPGYMPKHVPIRHVLVHLLQQVPRHVIKHVPA